MHNLEIQPYSLVLVAVLPQPRDMEIARLLGWYRIPLRSAPIVIDVDYLAFYHYSQFSLDQKNKDEAQQALDFYIRMTVVNPNDEKSAMVKPGIDLLKQKVK